MQRSAAKVRLMGLFNKVKHPNTAKKKSKLSL